MMYSDAQQHMMKKRDIDKEATYDVKRDNDVQ